MAIVSLAHFSRSFSEVIPLRPASLKAAEEAGQRAAAAWFAQTKISALDYRHAQRVAYVSQMLNNDPSHCRLPLSLTMHAFNSGFAKGLSSHIATGIRLNFRKPRSRSTA